MSWMASIFNRVIDAACHQQRHGPKSLRKQWLEQNAKWTLLQSSWQLLISLRLSSILFSPLGSLSTGWIACILSVHTWNPSEICQQVVMKDKIPRKPEVHHWSWSERLLCFSGTAKSELGYLRSCLSLRHATCFGNEEKHKKASEGKKIF